MQPAPLPAPAVRPDEPLAFFHQTAIRANMTLLSYNRIFAALVAGCVAGILGITGIKGFGMFVGLQLVIAAVLLLKTGFDVPKFFPAAGPSLFLSGIASQTELLTFILFWTLGNNLVYLY